MSGELEVSTVHPAEPDPGRPITIVWEIPLLRPGLPTESIPPWPAGWPLPRPGDRVFMPDFGALVVTTLTWSPSQSFVVIAADPVRTP